MDAERRAGQVPRGFRALLPPANWATLVQHGSRRTYEPGARLLTQGHDGGWLLILVAGRVKVLYAEPDGDEFLLAVRGPGDLLGEFSGMDNGPRSATIQAMERCIAYAWPRDRFVRCVRQLRVGTRLNHYIMGKVRESAAHTWQVAHHRTATRLASLFKDIIDAAGPDHPDPYTIPMSQDEMAAALGLVRSSVTPVLAEWKRAGLIQTGRARVTVTDLAMLLRERGHPTAS